MEKYQNKLTPDTVFLILGAIFGILLVFITPPFQSPDEYVHFDRTVSLTRGILLPGVDVSMPASLVDFASEVSPDPLPGNYQNKQSKRALLAEFSRTYANEPYKVVDDSASISYSPVAYLPQALGIGLGGLLHLPPILIFYLGRITSLAVWLGLVYRSIRISPCLRWFLCLLMLMPMVIFQAASLSPDGFLFGVCVLLVANFLRLIFSEKTSLSNMDLIHVGVCLIVIAAIKPLYLVLGGLYFLIPPTRYKGWVRYIATGFCLFIITALPAIIWLLVIKGQAHLSPGADPSLQLAWIRENFSSYLGVILRSMLIGIPDQAHMAVGVLGWADTPLPKWVVCIYLAALLAITLFDGKELKKLFIGKRLIPIILFILGSLAIHVYSYFYWTQPSATQVGGLQGRYFIPLFPLLAVALLNQKHRLPGWIGLAIIVFCCLILTVTLQSLILRYYIS